MSANNTCPNRGKPLAEGALDRLCPEYILKTGAVADSMPEPVVGPGGAVVPPGTPALSAALHRVPCVGLLRWMTDCCSSVSRCGRSCCRSAVSGICWQEPGQGRADLL